jgi:hypothetical protein
MNLRDLIEALHYPDCIDEWTNDNLPMHEMLDQPVLLSTGSGYYDILSVYMDQDHNIVIDIEKRKRTKSTKYENPYDLSVGNKGFRGAQKCRHCGGSIPCAC